MTADTLNDLLARAAAHPEAGLRLLDRRERATWAGWPEIHDAARRVAGGLRALEVAPGERVALIYPTGRDFFDAFFGTLLAGAVPAPLYPPARLGRLDEYHRRTAGMLAAASARLVLSEAHLRPALAPTLTAARPPLGCRALDELPAADPYAAAVEPEALALVQFSSGTTVDPKPVALTHRAIVAHTRQLNALWPPGAAVEVTGEAVPHSGVSWLPLYHDMGLIGCVFPALERPGVLTLFAPEVFVARPAVWLRTLSRYRATISVAPNFAYGLCVDKVRDDELEGVDLKAWQIALNGAEPVAPAVLRAFQRRFARWGFRPEALTPVYGLSEATLAVTFSPLAEEFRAARFDRRRLALGEAVPDPEGVELASVGRPLPGTEVAVVGGDGWPLPEGRVGRVRARGPSLMAGYLDRPAATAAALPGGWLDTGDLGFLAGGDLFLTARAKDVLILKGRNHAPAELEQAATTVAGVRSNGAVAVSYLPEGAASERLLLFVEHRRGATPATLEHLGAACVERALAVTGLRPDEVVVLPPATLPRTSSGKLRRQEALRLYLASELPPVAEPAATVAAPAGAAEVYGENDGG